MCVCVGGVIINFKLKISRSIQDDYKKNGLERMNKMFDTVF